MPGYWGTDPVSGQYGWIETSAGGTSTGGNAGQAAPQGSQSAVTPVVTYTPNGIPRQPGYYNPTNPYDTGRHGEQNRENNQGKGGKLNGWDYDKGAPMPGATLDANGMYTLGGGGFGGSGGGAGGGEGILESAYYQQVAAAVNAAAAADAAGRKSGVQQALISFGEAPSGFTDKYNDIDALTRELAEKNTTSGISTKARLLQGRADAIKMFNRAQTARGLRRSGNRGWGLRKRQLEHDQGYSDAVGKLLGYTGSLYSTFANNEYNRALQLANAALTASQMMNFSGGGSGGSGGLAGNSFTPAWMGTWAEGIDTGGYVPDSYDYGDPNDESIRPNVLTNVDPMQGTSLQDPKKGLSYY